MSQTAAIFFDAYRELNSKKLFWIVLGLSGLVVLAFLTAVFDERGWGLFGIHFFAQPNSLLIDRATFFKSVLYLGFGVGVWLSIIATILALISTAGIFPELMSGGSIELYLSKPISRIRLFFTRYAAALVFVFLQVLVFSSACFLVLGIRADVWLPGTFLAVPVVLVFYSFLYCICVLIGLLTRSTIAALLLTILFWLGVFALHLMETGSLVNKMHAQVAIERLERVVQEREARLRKFDADGGEATQVNRREPMVRALDQASQNLDAARTSLAANWNTGLFAIKTILPKTSETVALLERWTKAATDLDEPHAESPIAAKEEDAPAGSLFNPIGPDTFKAHIRAKQALDARSVGWVAGTSLAFEGVILALSAWIFCRRDY